MLTLKNDIVFKAVYGREEQECKEALMAVLNLILERERDPITSIEYRNPFNLRERPNQKESVLDIKAETSGGELLDLEIHLVYETGFIPKNLYYHGGLLKESLEKGQEYDKIKKTISIYIVNFTLFGETDQFHCRFQFKERDRNFPLTDMTQMHYLELPKVNPGRKKAVSELTELERYLEYLRCAGEPGQERYTEELRTQGGKEIAMTEHIMRKVTEEEILREDALARERFQMEKRMKERQLQEAMAENARVKEEAKQAKEELAQVKETIAQELAKLGLPADQIEKVVAAHPMQQPE